jgi:hypothetical protein
MKKAIKKMKVTIICMAVFLAFGSVNAGLVIQGSTRLKVTAGTQLISKEILVIKPGGILDNAGTMTLKKDLSNENTFPDYLGSGNIVFSGDTVQTITGQNIFTSLTVSNPDGISLGGNCCVNGVLQLNSGIVILGDYHLLIDSTGTISGSFSASSMIVPTGNGTLRREFSQGFTGSVLYPVGDQTNTTEYSPVTLQISGATFGTGNYIAVNLKNVPYPVSGIDGNYLSRYWSISTNAVTAIQCNLLFFYTVQDVNGDEGLLSCSRVDPLPRITFAPADIATHSLSANGVSDFGTFSGLKTTTPATINELYNITLPNGATQCYDALQHLVVAGNNSNFVVENGASATLIAGGMISMLPGTQVFAGGYLHAFITPDGNYCGSLPPAVVSSHVITADPAPIPILNPDQPNIKLYPNPVTDYVIVEFESGSSSGTREITLYALPGNVLHHEMIRGISRYRLDLTGQPRGMYLVGIRENHFTYTGKIIKN